LDLREHGSDGRRLAVISGPISALSVVARAANLARARHRRREPGKFIDALDSERQQDVFKDLAIWQREDVQLAVEKGMRLCCKAVEPEPVGNLWRSSMFDRTLLKALMLIGMVLPIASCSSPSLTSITISPSAFTTTLVLTSSGQSAPPSQQFWTKYTATGSYGHPGHPAITKDITDQVTWLSYTPLLVTINSSGVATVSGTATGFTQIAASMPGFNGDIISNASTFTVNLPTTITTSDVTSLAISPTAPTLPAVGKTQGFTVIGTTGTGQTENLTTAAVWTSSTPLVATISNTGLATATGVGTSVIVATYTNSDGTQVTASETLVVQ